MFLDFCSLSLFHMIVLSHFLSLLAGADLSFAGVFGSLRSLALRPRVRVLWAPGSLPPPPQPARQPARQPACRPIHLPTGLSARWAIFWKIPAAPVLCCSSTSGQHRGDE